jgi:hypothetical protein
MDTVTFLFTRRRWNPVSWLIRWAMPRSRFAFALSSHAIVYADGVCYEATMLHGVREVDRATALQGQTVVRERQYQVADLAAGILWAKSQLCTYTPNPPKWLPAWGQAICSLVQRLRHNNYDWSGAAGLGLAPDRNWAEAGRWFCYEFAAGFLRAAGRQVFADLSHVGETALMAIEP